MWNKSGNREIPEYVDIQHLNQGEMPMQTVAGPF